MTEIERLNRFKDLAMEILKGDDMRPLEELKLDDKTMALLESIASSKRPCLPGQVAAVQALLRALIEYCFAAGLGEMGIGKTQIAMELMKQLWLFLQGQKGTTNKMLFLTVGKLLGSMTKEAYDVLGDLVEVYEVVNKYKIEINPKGEAKKVRLKKNQVFPEDIIDMEVPDGKFQIFMMSKDTAKYGLKKELVINWGDYCSNCGTQILPKNWEKKSRKFPAGWKFRAHEFYPAKKPLNCPECLDSCEVGVAKPLHEGKLIFPHRAKKVEHLKGSRKISIGDRFRKQLKKRKEKHIFDLVVVDEVHEMQSPHSIQGKVYRDIVQISKRAFIMTGTLSNGKPSSIFYILQAIMPKYFKEKGYNFYDVGKFVDHFGARKHTKTKDRVEKRGSVTITKTNEMPLISEAIVSLLAPFTYWIKMDDLNLPMPSYREDAYIVEMDNDVRVALDEYKIEVVNSIKKHNPKLLKSFAQRFVYLQNNPTIPFKYEFDGIDVHIDEETQEVTEIKKSFSHTFTPLDPERVFSKEQELIDYVKKELEAGRKCMIYSIYNKVAEISDRLGKVISDALGTDHTVKVMPETVGGSRILPWIENNPADVMICSPLKVSTGLNLVQFPTIIFYETGTNLRVVQQASRRSWRAFGQDFPVKVAFFAYQGLQAQLLDGLGKKLKGAAIVEGRAVESGQLASLFDDDADITEALNNIAKEIDKNIKPDFSSSIIEEGKMRPNTKYEQAYIDILEKLTGINELEFEKNFEKATTDAEVVSEEIDEEDTDIIIEDDKSENIVEEISETVDDEIEVISAPETSDDVKVACKCKPRQLLFEF